MSMTLERRPKPRTRADADPVPRTLVARIRAAVAEWYNREPIDLDDADRPGRMRP